MGVSNFKELVQHYGHKIVCVGYGKDAVLGRYYFQGVAIECETCNEVLLDYDKEE